MCTHLCERVCVCGEGGGEELEEELTLSCVTDTTGKFCCFELSIETSALILLVRTHKNTNSAI